MQNDIALEEFGRKLLQARTRKGLSQRALAERTGVPQAHISKIEQGRVDIRLSSLVELARALDLDVQLLPRQAVPTIEGAVRALASDAGDSVESRALSILARQERTLEAVGAAYPDLAAAQTLLPTIKALKLLPYDVETVKALERAAAPIEDLRQRLVAGGVDPAGLTRWLEQANLRLRALRNARFHERSSAPPQSARHAYQLDDGDDDD